MDEKKPGQDHQKKPRHGGENLRPPWPKGVSGNPGGRPKGTSIIKIIRQMLDEPASILVKPDMAKLTVAEFMAVQAIIYSGKGRSAYFRELIAQLEGRAPIRIEHSTAAADPADANPKAVAAMLRAGLETCDNPGGPDE
jgi:hypothetical protein